MERIGRRASYVEEEEKLRLSEPPLSPLLLPPPLPWHGRLGNTVVLQLKES